MIDLPKTEVLAQLAEEASELAQAALKLRRVLDGTNPTPVTMKEAKMQMMEEIADVLLCLRVAGFNPAETYNGWLDKRMAQKLRRWEKRLKEAREGKDG